MKKIYFTFLLSLFFISQKAQVVFCPPHAGWSNVFTRSWPDQTLEYENVIYTGKQVIGNDTVKVLSHRRFFMMTNLGYTGPTYIKQKGDTIFMKNVRTQNNWQILYNFAATVGSSWNNTIIGGTPLSTTKIVSYTTMVVSTQTVNVNGYNLKQLTVLQNQTGLMSPNAAYFNITERLGSSSYLFHFLGSAATDGDTFVENVCYSDSVFGTYQIGAHACNYLTLLGVNEAGAHNNALSIYPNPGAGDLNLSSDYFSDEKYTYTISNAQGQVILKGEFEVNQQSASIPTALMAQGLYNLSISKTGNENNIVFTKRFVKTE